MPWYVIWVLPLAALGKSLNLRRVALIFTAYLVFGFAPSTGMWLSKLGINLMNSPAGQASTTLQTQARPITPCQICVRTSGPGAPRQPVNC